MKLSIAIVQCPSCGRVLAAKDLDDMRIHDARCPECGLLINVFFDEFGHIEEIRERTIH